ncbi:MAG: RHS repeat domain-containing protein [Roseburia intestinalis]
MRIRKKIGLYYNRFRYYDPSLGQYTQQDPIGLAGGNPTLLMGMFLIQCGNLIRLDWIGKIF